MYYPEFDEKSLWALDVIRQNIDQDPEYLDNSPYTSNEVQSLLKLTRERSGEVAEVAEGSKWEILETETTGLYKSLKETFENLKIDDHTERMSYFRTATSLLDKLVGLQERAAGLKKVHEFQQTVLDIMEDILEPGQRTEVMDRLRKSINDDK